MKEAGVRGWEDFPPMYHRSAPSYSSTHLRICKEVCFAGPSGGGDKDKKTPLGKKRVWQSTKTIVQREELNRQVAENYFFVPGMGNVPEIAVPDFLPDLLG
ncbi:hypothetical protein NP493_5223g00024 [Ridgeia piscesae]|uniref:WASH1 WAHD domain-containing protein n=1 Tax=Ridgeia piscesae TaxID=27915 RepID=A0AAD9IVU9_RIDPI|nr:hypothetical protein NP493_5223g00024 [Ridgeia piscesae]